MTKSIRHKLEVIDCDFSFHIHCLCLLVQRYIKEMELARVL